MSLLNNCTDLAFKFLSSVEIDNYGSNQHELHGARAFKNLFGYNKQRLQGTITYIDTNNISSRKTQLTWYDSREFNFNRSEYRFYYTSEISDFKPNVNDLLLISHNRLNNQVVIVIIHDKDIIKKILRNKYQFKEYNYPNGSSYYAEIKNIPWITNII
ncbi:hypothetical protein [Clostridium perfringens]|uniref:hypothetical protein n=1 Tax=Clostridium perfringens TaxID=1502 RepID=UPI001CC96FCD|nr:hypothetical protein [Clostridium perfringens]MCX0408721.1 hypothetical protein [Clostridium perfringens]UBK88811.1 hypothetical protein KLF48_14775 [Clostridium perfringens]